MTDAGERRVRFDVRISRRCMNWIDSHPRVGWYLVALSVLNLLLNTVDLFK